MKLEKTYKVIATGGVYVRYTDNPLSGIVKILPYDTVFKAEYEPNSPYVKTEDGYVLNEPFILEELSGKQNKSSKE